MLHERLCQAVTESGPPLFSAHAATNGSYIHMGTTADLFENTDRKGTHYAEESGVPVWEVLDSSGAVAGSVKGRALTKVAREGSPMDGGFGSVDSVLYVTYDAEGEPALWASVPT